MESAGAARLPRDERGEWRLWLDAGAWRSNGRGSPHLDYGRASCPDGQKALGGGYLGQYYGDIRTTPYVLTPFGSLPGIGGRDWLVYMINDTPVPIPFRPYAICASVF